VWSRARARLEDRPDGVVRRREVRGRWWPHGLLDEVGEVLSAPLLRRIGLKEYSYEAQHEDELAVWDGAPSC
jgi:hypothetical protein